uniref:Uncharacterized protein n=1 Tax=Aegilops tauschii TaxID=37682 RepID=M8CUG9_AEGTA
MAVKDHGGRQLSWNCHGDVLVKGLSRGVIATRKLKGVKAGQRTRGFILVRPLAVKAAHESWSSAAGGAPAPTPRNAAVSGSGNDAVGAGGGGAPPAHSKSRASAFLSALMRWRPRVNVMGVLCEHVVYHMMWLVESVVLVGRLCFFLMRFGFKQL